MSTLSVNAITDSSGGNTATINSATPNAYNTVGKNLIINGAMQIAQRATSATGLTSTGNYVTVDRFRTMINSLGTWTAEQSTDAPSGFANSLKYSCTATGTSSAGSYLMTQTRLEGLSLQHLNKGTADAEKITLSFWLKSNKTGTIQVNVYDVANVRNIAGTATINSADTWEKKTITFDGDTSGTLANSNAHALRFEWVWHMGSAYTSGAVPTAWEAYDATDRAAGVTLTNPADSTSNYFSMTGVQLEVGSTATEFEHRPYTTELQLCQRYYQRVGGNGNSGEALWSSYGATYNYSNWKFTVTMRATPTIGGTYAGSLCRTRVC